MITNKFILISILLIASVCGPNEEAKKALETSKDLYEINEKLDQSIKESNRKLDSLNRNSERGLERKIGDFEKITPITDAKKSGKYDSIKVKVLEYEE